jgi:hypothetical protein
MKFSDGPLQVEISDSLRNIQSDWDEFHAHQPWLKSNLISAPENAHPSDMTFRYVMIRKNDEVVACAYLQLVSFSKKNFSQSGPSLLVPILKLLFAVKKIHLLFCGNIFRVDFPCLHWREEHISFEQILKIIKQIGEKENAMLLMMKEMNYHQEKLNVLEKNGFRKYEHDLTMALDLKNSWNNFNDYHHSLTKKYRKRLRLIRNAKSPLTVRRLNQAETKKLLPQIGDLFNQTASRQFLRMGIIDENYFSTMSETFGDDFFINGYFLGEQLIAFASHLIHKEMLEVHYIGIDYSFNEKYSLYFNILYDGLEMAIEMKKKILELGRTAREAKASVGCKPVPSYDYLFVQNRFTNFLVGVFENIFLDKMGDEWKNRQPFKLRITNHSELPITNSTLVIRN